MKAKFLWASLLLFAGITACTDDAIETQTGNSSKGEGTPAYLTISFTANSGSSTRANNGDEHGSADESGHKSTGIEEESKVTSALVVVSPVSTATDAVGFAKVYSTAASTGSDAEFTMVDNNSQMYQTAEPIEIVTGDYNVLVVINPATTLTGDNQLDADNQTSDIIKVRALYNKILTGNYAYTATSSDESDESDESSTTKDNYTNAANSIGMGLGYDGTSKDGAYFMMANKAAATVTVDASNTLENPAPVDVTVERVLSKITFREKAESGNLPKNAYPVTVNLGSAPAITEVGLVQDEGSSPATYTEYTFNKAKDALDNEVYALYNKDGDFQAVYKKGSVYDDPDDKYAEDIYIFTQATAYIIDVYNDLNDKTNAYAVSDVNNNNQLDEAEKAGIELELDPNAAPEIDTWYVKLEGYSLVNLAKSVNYVRHTVGVGGGMQAPFGTLSATNYLWTPNWEAKNNVDLDDENFTVESGWYYNTLADVSADSKVLAVDGNAIDWDAAGLEGCFRSFTDGLIEDGSEVTGGDSHAPGGSGTQPNVGQLMSYCFENSTDQSHQVHGLSTGISFVGRIYSDEACTQPIEKLYLYAEHNYTSLKQIQEAYGNATPQAILDMIADPSKETKENLEKAGVTLYNGNVCYYYTTEIKHFDNGKNDGEEGALGVNEFIIMRNNIYSLAVTTIEDIGAPFVDPTPNTPNESVKAALQVNVQIVPWIVRYNDIEF